MKVLQRKLTFAAMKHQFVYLSLGSNLGHRASILQEARRLIVFHCGSIIQASRVYETAAWGFFSAQPFLNQVIGIETNDLPNQLLEKLMKIEAELGRLRSASGEYVSRTLDIDILFYGQQLVNEPDLVIPHPKLHQRKFVLVPLCEIAPAYVHPLFHQTTQQLFQSLSDPLSVELFDEFDNP